MNNCRGVSDSNGYTFSWPSSFSLSFVEVDNILLSNMNLTTYPSNSKIYESRWIAKLPNVIGKLRCTCFSFISIWKFGIRMRYYKKNMRLKFCLLYAYKNLTFKYNFIQIQLFSFSFFNENFVQHRKHCIAQ